MEFAPKNPDDNPFINNEMLGELRDKVIDTLRPLGLTVDPEDVVFTMHPEHGMLLMIPALVRPSAGEKIEDARVAREEFNRMMANEAEAKLAKRKEDIAKAISEGNLEDVLFGGTDIDSAVANCMHENMHPSGFCLDCGWGMEDEE